LLRIRVFFIHHIGYSQYLISLPLLFHFRRAGPRGRPGEERRGEERRGEEKRREEKSRAEQKLLRPQPW